MHSTHQGFLWKCKLWLSKFEMGLKFCICNKFPGGPQALSSKELQHHSWEFNVMGTDPLAKQHHVCSGYLLLCIKPPPNRVVYSTMYYSESWLGLAQWSSLGISQAVAVRSWLALCGFLCWMSRRAHSRGWKLTQGVVRELMWGYWLSRLPVASPCGLGFS